MVKYPRSRVKSNPSKALKTSTKSLILPKNQSVEHHEVTQRLTSNYLMILEAYSLKPLRLKPVATIKVDSLLTSKVEDAKNAVVRVSLVFR